MDDSKEQGTRELEMNQAFDSQIAYQAIAGETACADNDYWGDRELRCRALEAALKTDNPSRDELVKTAETLYAFLKGPSA